HVHERRRVSGNNNDALGSLDFALRIRLPHGSLAPRPAHHPPCRVQPAQRRRVELAPVLELPSLQPIRTPLESLSRPRHPRPQ
ncbi:hypothetical protein BGZ52_012763, partial [Haplosporangium bisporale]